MLELSVTQTVVFDTWKTAHLEFYTCGPGPTHEGLRSYRWGPFGVSGVLFLSRNLEGGCGRVGPGQELVEAALGMTVDDAADHVGQVGPRLDADQLAGLDQGRDHRPVRGPTVRARKEGIAPVESEEVGLSPFLRPLAQTARAVFPQAAFLCGRRR